MSSWDVCMSGFSFQSEPEGSVRWRFTNPELLQTDLSDVAVMELLHVTN